MTGLFSCSGTECLPRFLNSSGTLESGVARDACGEPKATLGTILQRYPGLFPKPLDVAVEKVWAFAPEMGRHLREGREPSRLDTELVVGLAAVLAAHLKRKLRVRQRAADRAIDEPCSHCGKRAIVMEEGCGRCLACGWNEC